MTASNGILSSFHELLKDKAASLNVLKQQCKYELDDMNYAEFEKIGKELISDDAECADAMKKTFKMLDESNKGYISSADMKKTLITYVNLLSAWKITPKFDCCIPPFVGFAVLK